MSTDTLFEPFDLNGTTLANRIVMAPMTRSRAEPGALPSAFAVEYYSQRAGAGLIITEAIGVCDRSLGYLRTPGLFSDAQVEGWKHVTDAVHAKGGRIAAQLWHVGRVFHPENNPDFVNGVAPSAIPAKTRIFTPTGLKPPPVPQEMTTQDVAQAVEAFAHTAEMALKAGFDAVELHGANGYLIEQFACDQTNRRDDRYGGSLEKRLTFLWDILDAIMARGIPLSKIGVRLSPFGTWNDIAQSDPEAVFRAQIQGLEERHVGFIHVIEPVVSGSGDASDTPPPADVATIARGIYGGILIVAGGYDRDRAQATLDAGKADLIAFGRPFISNPDLVSRLHHRHPIAESNRDTHYTPGAEGYVDYPVWQ